jgi:hypothetical protein
LWDYLPLIVRVICIVVDIEDGNWVLVSLSIPFDCWVDSYLLDSKHVYSVYNVYRLSIVEKMHPFHPLVLIFFWVPLRRMLKDRCWIGWEQ